MSKHTKLKLIPSHLPAIRNKLAQAQQEQLVKARTQLEDNKSTDNQFTALITSYWDEIEEFRTAPLWWVSHDMFLIALDAAESHTAPQDTLPPSHTGLIYFDGDFPTIVLGGKVLPNVCAVVWTVDTANGIGLRYYSRHTSDRALPLFLVEPDPQYAHDNEFTRLNQLIVRTLKATWALSSIPTLSSVSVEQGANNTIKAGVPQHNPINQVKILTLREQQQSRENLIDKRTNKPYSHRFIVRGYYRNQPYGKKSALRRKQWIPPFIKGPADKPLMIKETVRVWRR